MSDLAAAFISVKRKKTQRKIKHQYNKMVQLNTAVQIRLFPALISDLDTMKNTKIKY